MRYLRNAVAILVLALVWACTPVLVPPPAAERAPQLGERMPCTPGPAHLVTAAAQTYPSCEFAVDRLKFDLAADPSGQVVFIACHDPAFRTPDGIRIGSSLREVLSSGGQQPVPEPGWGVHSLLPSGWHAVFAEIPSATPSELKPETEVAWLFRRK
jgi:hypothetical protein